MIEIHKKHHSCAEAQRSRIYKNMKLSIVMPAFNEAETIEEMIRKVMAVDVGIDKELIVVDDCSSDGTRDILEKLKDEKSGLKVVLRNKNLGKGAALRDGFAEAEGDIVVIQDADLEYDPNDYLALLAPILDGHADVVYGSRFLGGGPHRVVFYWHYLGNRFLTTLSNMLTDLNLTDMEVCYKMFRKEVLDSINLKENRFGFEVEVTAKVARGKRWRIYEMPISYYGGPILRERKLRGATGFGLGWLSVSLLR